MERKLLWKNIFIQDRHDFYMLRVYYASRVGAWRRWTVVSHQGLSSIETNLPYSELRRWFRYAIDKPIPGHVTGDQPTWEERREQ